MRKRSDETSFQLAVLYVDMRSSTKIARRLTTPQMKVYYQTFLDEMIAIIEDFGGKPFKTVGDCVVGFFFASDGFQWADNVIRCGTIMIEVVRNNISPYLKKKGLPELACRVGADYGEAQMIRLSSHSLQVNMEVIGSVMNIAAKIQGQADTNEMYIGHSLAKLVYTDYRMKFEHKKEKDVIFDEETYKIFKVNL